MASGIPVALVILSLLIPSWAAAQAAERAAPVQNASILVRYSFDETVLDTGPDTFTVFQNAKGSVRLSTLNRLSGYQSIEIRDAAGDGDFPELQGYFQQRTSGKLFMHFALMVTNPSEELNIALAGPEWFTLRRNGIAFWLKTIDGYLCHYSDSMPKKLFAMTPFVWYVVNTAYDIDAGTYDMTIHEEGRPDPIVSVRKQPNAPSQPASAIDKFSFIGDAGSDRSAVMYYVDDVVLGVNESVTQLPFAAPGRRKLFVDYWNDYQLGRHSQPGLLPVMELSDLGFQPGDLQSIRNDGLEDVLQQALAGHAAIVPDGVSPASRRLLEAVISSNAGAAAFKSGQLEAALARFEEAARAAPAAKLHAMNSVLTLAALGKWAEADLRLQAIHMDWRDDVRFPAAAAMIGIARQDLLRAEEWLRDPAERASAPSALDALIAEQYFYVLLWQNQADRAAQFAERMAERHRLPGLPSALWLERRGDAAFALGDSGGALRWYEDSLAAGNSPSETRVLLKLSDVYFRLGDLQKERIHREKIYGRLNPH
jgi:tetratricopeptide (TPR) repeat protein